MPSFMDQLKPDGDGLPGRIPGAAGYREPKPTPVRIVTPKPKPVAWYVYRCTTQQLEDSLNRITEAGDKVIHPVHVGGRDWIIFCHKADVS